MLLNLKSATPAALIELANHEGDELRLSGLSDLTVEQAEALSHHKGLLNLTGVEVWPDEVLKALTKHEGFGLTLNFPQGISVEQAEILNEYKGTIEFKIIKDLSLEAAQVLAKHMLREDTQKLADEGDAKGLSFYNLQTMPQGAFEILKDKADFYNPSEEIQKWIAMYRSSM